jgi:hypothetical protein
MKHINGHTTQVIPGTMKRSPVGGIEFHLSCCGEHEHSVHIQNAHQFAKDLEALDRVVEEHHMAVANTHEAQKVVEAFMQRRAAECPEDCGCQ